MAKPTDKQIRDLEAAHKMAYIDLVLANKLFLSFLPKLAGKSKTSKEYIAVLNYGKAIAKNAGKWYARQYKLEKLAKIPPVHKDILKYFLNPKTQTQLLEIAKEYVAPSAKNDPMFNPMGYTISGIGIIPLIVWGVIAIVGAFTAYEITDQLTTTAEEKADLLKATETTLKELNITGQQAASIINSTQQQATEGSGIFSGVGSIMKLVPWAIGIWAANEFLLKPQKNVAKG